MFEELLPRVKWIELGGEVTRVRSNFVNGIKRFPLPSRPPRRGAPLPLKGLWRGLTRSIVWIRMIYSGTW